MELLEPLRDELEENYQLLSSTEELIREQRDMLQGETEKRIALLKPYDDVWSSIVSAGQLKEFEEAVSKVSQAYRKLSQISSVIEKFNRYGPRIVYTPLLKQTTAQYNRKNLVDIIREMCSESAVTVMSAKEAVEEIMRTECPVCGRRFKSRGALKSHVTQKTDAKHEAIKERMR